MTQVVHNKLVRDNIPQIITASGATAHTKILSEDEYRHELLRKLVEEATELLESGGSVDERADVAEVLRSIDDVFAYGDKLETVRSEKAAKRGGFEKRIYLERTEE